MAGDWIVSILGGMFGALFGSFLNVCIVRLPKNESVVSPRSRCPSCGLMVAWYDNIPVASWLMLRGKCRGCQLPISVLYPVVELLVALLWGWMAWRHGFGLEGLRGAVFGTLLIGIAFTDAREYIIPNEFSVGGLVIGLLFAAAGGLAAFQVAALGAGIGFGLLWLVGAVGTWAFKEEAMGGGDIKMMAMVGAFVGWKGVLLTVFLGALIGTMVFLPLMLMGKKKLVPFGVFLAIGAVATYLLGPAIFDWYGRYLGVG
ncbi:MAG: prepilin peptidase [Gemmatimonadota bacterium]|nr:prepilin peptidase [Gemmatimonadota bacterium]